MTDKLIKHYQQKVDNNIKKFGYPTTFVLADKMFIEDHDRTKPTLPEFPTTR